MPGLKYDLKNLDEKRDDGEYAAEALLNAVAAAAFFFALLCALRPPQLQLPPELSPAAIAGALSPLADNAVPALGLFLAVLALYLYNPHLQAVKKGEGIDKDLVFALKSMLLQVRSGAPVDSALASVISQLSQNQRTQIKNYSAELNLWVLLYTIFAVALPGMGSAVIIILSSFGTVALSEPTFVTLIMISAIAQAALVQLIKIRRPAVHL
ncbi:MAG: hypothetical protein WC792_00110 [Candidatus Micrarchaeia archaeon]